MKKKDNRVCIVCGRKYEYCPSCQQKASSKWKILFDAENCREMYNLLAEYVNDDITKEDAKARLDELSLDDLGKYSEKVQATINEILGVKAPKRTKETETL